MILNVFFKKIIFQNSLMANETPSRPPPPPLMANAILNFHFDFLTPSLSLSKELSNINFFYVDVVKDFSFSDVPSQFSPWQSEELRLWKGGALLLESLPILQKPEHGGVLVSGVDFFKTRWNTVLQNLWTVFQGILSMLHTKHWQRLGSDKNWW